MPVDYKVLSFSEDFPSTSSPADRVFESICSSFKCLRTRSSTAIPTATSAAVHSKRSTNKTLITTEFQDNRWRLSQRATGQRSPVDCAESKRATTDLKALTAL